MKRTGDAPWASQLGPSLPKRSTALAVFVLVALVFGSDVATGQLPKNVHLGATAPLPDSVRESSLGGLLTIEVARTARDTTQRRMI